MNGSSLAGFRVVVTRASSQASALVELLEGLGAEVVSMPTIEIVDPADDGAALRAAAADLSRYEWVVVTSSNGAERLIGALPVRGAFEVAGARIAVIGPGTADALRRQGVEPDLVPDRFVAEGLLDTFPAPSGRGRVLLAQAGGARTVLREGLAALGWEVEVVEAYRTTRPALSAEQRGAVDGADAVTFTSASTVRGFIDAVGVEARPRVVACIGPITAQAARDVGLGVDVEAGEHTIPGLVDALVEHLTGTGT